MGTVDELMKKCRNELGYIEKSKEAYNLYGDVCLWPKTEYCGSSNYTKYAVIAEHPNGQAWCQTFIAAMFIDTFGREIADKLLCGKVESASTMEVKNAMVAAGRQIPLDRAVAGDICYRSRSGGGHVGICDGWENGKIVTIEGNSSDTDKESWNGGKVVRHVGANWMWCVRPDWSILDWHWVCENGIWYYQNAIGLNSYGWKSIKETNGEHSHWYYFNTRGQMLKGIQKINGSYFALMPEGDLEGACCKTNDSGELYIWNC